MHRIDASGAVGGQFSNGDPALGVLGTQVDAAWANAVQEALAQAIEGLDITLVKGDDTQLLDALLEGKTALVTAGANWDFSTLSNRYAKLRKGMGTTSFAFHAEAQTGASWNSIATFPAGFRPVLGVAGEISLMGVVQDVSAGAAGIYPARFRISSGSGLMLLDTIDNGTSLVSTASVFTLAAGDLLWVTGSFPCA